MAVLTNSRIYPFSVHPGNQVLRISQLDSGTLYAVYIRALSASRRGDPVVPSSSGPGGGNVVLGSLTAAAQGFITAFQTETGSSAFPAGYLVAGATANYARSAPQFSIDSDSSSDITRVIRVAIPDFNSPPADGLNYIEVRVSRNNCVTFPEVMRITAPFTGTLNYGVVSVSVPYDTDINVVAQAFFKDGTPGRLSRTLTLRGYAKPSVNTLTAPTIASVTGAQVYVSATNTVRLSLTVTGVPDPLADSMKVNIVNAADNTPKDSRVANVDPANPTATLSITFDNLDSSVATYNVIGYSTKFGVDSVAASTTYTTSSAALYHPPKILVSSIKLAEIIQSGASGLESVIKITWDSDRTQPGANIYLRRHDNFQGDTSSFAGFSLAGSSITGSYITVPMVAGATVTWDAVVLAVGITGTEALFTSDQIKNVAVQQYSGYAPLVQAIPTVTVVSEDQISIKGTYARPTNTPKPLFVNIYKSETSALAADLVVKVPLQVSSDPTIYNWTYDVQSLKNQFSISGVSLVTIRYALENGTETATSLKTVVKTIATVPSTVPIVSAATAYVKTVGVTITNCSATTTSAVASYTSGTGGNGTQITFTPPLNSVIIEVSDDGVGTNPETITPQTDLAAPIMWCSFAPTHNQGTKYIRAKFNTLFGVTGFSTPAKSIAFPADALMDTTLPDLTPCVPRFVSSPTDGSITISWTAATFGTSGMGSYVIRRATSAAVGSSYAVGMMTTTTTLSWTDALSTDKQGYTYYYWLEATSGQGMKSASPVVVKLASANTWAVETTAGAVSTDAIPASVASITAVGAQGGFNVTWAGVADRDIKEYSLEFSALGSFSDTVTVAVQGSSYYQTLGAIAAAAVATVYRWRVRAKDFGNQYSSSYATTAAPDLTNYGSIQDSAPSAPSAATLIANTDGSITVGLSASTASYFHIKRLSSTAAWTPVTSGTGDASKIEAEDIIDGASSKYTDTGLNPNKFYTYQVFTRSKLGTDSTTFAAPPAPVQAQYIVPGVTRRSLIFNGHFGTAKGEYGSSASGWTLGTGATAAYTAGTYGYNSNNFSIIRLVKTGATAAVCASQVFQVIPGRKYTVLGILFYQPTTNDGRAYIRVASAGALSDAAGGATVPPAPYPSTMETSGQDYTAGASAAYRFISYSFTSPAGVSQMTLNIGYENKSASDNVNLYPGFIQVYQDQ